MQRLVKLVAYSFAALLVLAIVVKIAALLLLIVALGPRIGFY